MLPNASPFKLPLHLVMLLMVVFYSGGVYTLLPAQAASGALNDIPPDSVRTPPMVKEHSLSTYVPSEAAKGKGVAVNLIYPQKPRYKDGAPVAVVIPGGIGPDGLSFEMHASQVGMIEVRFAFPGGGTAQFGTQGEFDNRGENSLLALRDVILFAGGKSTDYQGRTIGELLKPVVKAQPSDIGIIGWDIGGNQALVVMGKYHQELSFLKWLVFYESPVGSMFWPAALGSASDLKLNNHYREGSAATGSVLLDYRKLWWNKDGYRNPNRLAARKRGSPGLKGVLFFDENLDGVWEESSEYAFQSALDVGLTKQFFPPQVAGGAERIIFKNEKGFPPNVATPTQSDEFFADRDGSLYIETVCKEYPNLMVSLFASAADHNQQQPDHPHIAFLYNLLLTHNVRFLRLNPDPNYMVSVGGMNKINFVNNKPNAAIDAATILTLLEPEGLLPDYVYIEASAAELADRTKGKIFKETLSGTIIDYTNGAEETPKPEPPAPKPASKKEEEEPKGKAEGKSKGSAKDSSKAGGRDSTQASDKKKGESNNDGQPMEKPTD